MMQLGFVKRLDRNYYMSADEGESADFGTPADEGAWFILTEEAFNYGLGLIVAPDGRVVCLCDQYWVHGDKSSRVILL